VEFFADTLCEGICREYVGIKRKGSYSSYRTDFGFVSIYNSLSNFGYVSMGAANSSVVIDDNNDVQINAQGKLKLLTPNYNTSSNGSVLTLIDSINGECEWRSQNAIPLSGTEVGKPVTGDISYGVKDLDANKIFAENADGNISGLSIGQYFDDKLVFVVQQHYQVEL
jgi:hypothetical protein